MMEIGSSILSALSLPCKGKVYDLGIELSRHTPVISDDIQWPINLITYRTPEGMARLDGMNGVSFHVDSIQGTLHVGTHIDALVHCQYRGRVYGGASASELRDDFGWRAMGIEMVEPIVGRGVLVDAASYANVDRFGNGEAVSKDGLVRALSVQGTELRQGDIVLVRTGKIREIATNPEEYGKGCPGITREAAEWLIENGMRCLGIDSPSADPDPISDWSASVHVLLLVERGVNIIENLNLEAMAADGCYEFFFVCSPLKIKGATGSWVRPVAIS